VKLHIKVEFPYYILLQNSNFSIYENDIWWPTTFGSHCNAAVASTIHIQIDVIVHTETNQVGEEVTKGLIIAWVQCAIHL